MFEHTFQGPGFSTYTNHSLEILIMLLVAFLLGLVLGYILWYHWRSQYAELENDYKRLKAIHTDTEKDNISLKYKTGQLDKENMEYRQKARIADADLQIARSKLMKLEAEMSELAADKSKKQVLGAAPKTAGKPDDLKKIEGIGPKIAGLFKKAGIVTFHDLANAKVETLQRILDDAGPQYNMADPATWPKQAALAAEGKWDELKEWQDKSTGGRPV